MAGFGFAPNQVGGFGGGLLSQGMGTAIGNAANAGLRLANGFREYQNNNMLDQFQVPAAEAGYDNARVQGANGVVEGQALNAALLKAAGQSATPNTLPAGQIPSPDHQQQGPATFYQSPQGQINQNGMRAVGADMVLGNPYPNSVYGSNAFQQALTGTDPNSPLNYHPSTPTLQY